jgi:hypothetical protein
MRKAACGAAGRRVHHDVRAPPMKRLGALTQVEQIALTCLLRAAAGFVNKGVAGVPACSACRCKLVLARGSLRF